MNTLLYWLVHNAVVIAVMIIPVTMVCHLFRDRPKVQHLFWLVVLLKFVTPVIVLWPWALEDISAVMKLPSSSATAPLVADASLDYQDESTRLEFASPAAVLPADNTADPIAIPHGQSRKGDAVGWFKILPDLLVFAWIAGAVVCLVFQSRRIFWFQRAVNRAVAAPELLLNQVNAVAHRMGVRSPRVRVINGIQSPVVWCFGWPTLLWPDSLISSTDLERSDILIAHELAHLRRFDHWILRLELVARIIWWWNPLLSFVQRRLNEAAETACDALALSTFADQRREYAEFLLKLSCQSRNDRSVAFLRISGGTIRFFEQRLTMVLSDRVDCRTSVVGGAAVILFALATFPSWSLAQQGAGKHAPTDAHADAPSKAPAAANQAEVPLRTIAGKVVDENGKPIDGAQIVWHIAFGKPDVMVETTTDGEGRFRCSTPDATPKLPTWNQDTLWVFKSGKRLTTANTRRDGDHDEKLQQLEIRLIDDVFATYTIVSADQSPMPDVAIEPWHFRTHLGFAIVPPLLRRMMTNKSDAEGRVRISRFDRRTLHAIHAVSEKLGTQQIRMDTESLNGDDPKIELLPAARVRGQLVAKDPKLFKGVEVYLTTHARNQRMDEGFAHVKTNAEGRFDVPAMPVGTLRIMVSGDDDASELPRIPNAELSSDAPLDIVIEYEPSVTVWGTIHADDTDAAVPGAQISVRYGSWRQGATVISDANGRYEAKVLAGDVYTQVISIPKEFATYEQVGAPWNEQIKVPFDNLAFKLPSIGLQPTQVLDGQVLLQDGKPAAKANINAVHKNRRYGFTTTNEAGEFSMRLPGDLEIGLFELWLDDDQRRIECEVEQEDPLVVRAKGPA